MTLAHGRSLVHAFAPDGGAGSISGLDGLRALAHRMVDDAFDDHARLPERAVWRPMPGALAPSFEASAPRTGVDAEAVAAITGTRGTERCCHRRR